MKYLLLLPAGRYNRYQMSEEQVKRNAARIFLCGICSDEKEQVYHNLAGQHNHELKKGRSSVYNDSL